MGGWGGRGANECLGLPGANTWRHVAPPLWGSLALAELDSSWGAAQNHTGSLAAGLGFWVLKPATERGEAKAVLSIGYRAQVSRLSFGEMDICCIFAWAEP